MDEAARELVGSLQSIAPQAWAAMIRQARLEAWISLIWCVFWIFVAVFWLRFLRTSVRLWKASGESDLEDWRGVWRIVPLVLVGLVFLIAFPLTLNDAIRYVVNPEFMAIKWLLSTIS